MRRYRVAQLVSGVEIGKRCGGAELHSLQIARNLSKDEFEPAVFGLWSYDSEIERRWIETLNVEGIPVTLGAEWSGNFYTDLRATYEKLAEFTGKFQPDIVHSHSERTSLIASLIRLWHHHHPKTVRTVHIDKQWQTRPLFGILAEGIAFPFIFNAEIGVSQAIVDGLRARRFFNRSQIVLCYNSIDDAAFQNGSTEAQAESLPPKMLQTPLRIGIIGRLTHQKGHDVLLKAVHHFQIVQDFQLIIIGDGPLRAELQTLVNELDLDRKVQFLGVRNDVETIIGHLDLLALPSRWEGFPTVILEAMAKNVPVVATDIPGTRELVIDEQTGWLVPVDNHQELANVMENILQDSELTRTVTVNARQFASNFTISKMVQCYEESYRALLH